MRRIVLPQAIKRMLPAFMEGAIELMRTATLVATVSYADLLFQANEVSQKTFRPLEALYDGLAAVLRRDLRRVNAGQEPRLFAAVA